MEENNNNVTDDVTPRVDADMPIKDHSLRLRWRRRERLSDIKEEDDDDGKPNMDLVVVVSAPTFDLLCSPFSSRLVVTVEKRACCAVGYGRRRW